MSGARASRHARATLATTYLLYTALESPRVIMAMGAAMPAKAVQPDVDSRVMESASDLMVEMKLTLRPSGASKEQSPEATKMHTKKIEAAIMMRNEMVLSGGVQGLGTRHAHEASGDWYR